MIVSEIATRAAEKILPDHYHVEEDCWFSCPEHPDSCRDDVNGCNCGLEERRRSVAAIVQAAIDEAHTTGEPK